MRHIIALLICCFVVINVNAESGVCQQRNCLAVVDSGSTGSRLHIYAYDLDSHQHPVQISELWSKKIKPGLAMIDSDPQALDAHLTALFTGAPEDHMPVYFFATAGMRLISKVRQQAVYQSIQQWFVTQPQWKLMEATTITGQEEGVYGWLAVNYKLGAFGASGTTQHTLVGVMDMGGASVQITFPVQNTEKINPNDIYNIDVNGHHFVLFAHSFLGLGQTLLSQQFLDERSCFANGYQLPSHLSAKGDAFFCQYDVSKLINSVHGVNHIVKQPIAANAVDDWYTIGGIAPLVEDKLFGFSDQQFTNQRLLEQADIQICHQSWQALITQFPENEYLYGYCLSASYYYALMVDGYGLKPDQPVNYMPSGQDIDWTLGVVLHQH